MAGRSSSSSRSRSSIGSRRRRRNARRGASSAISALLVAAVISIGGPARASTFSFAVIGDIPYGSTQLQEFPGRIGQINADPDVQLASHLGDIGADGSNCSDSYYATIKSDFDTFVDPLVYTPGDNEWADCHRAAIGRADPFDRLAAVRAEFFAVPGQTLGQNAAAVTPQSGYPENVRLEQDGVTFSAIHLVGSNNDLNAWTGLGYTQPTTAQLAEEKSRAAAAVTWIKDTFAKAEADNSRAVVLLTQADMFVGTPGSTYRTAFQSVVRTIASESRAFVRPVFLFNGDTHVFRSDKPLTSSTWLSFYGISGAVSNLSRITIEGGSTVDEWVKVTVVASSSVLQVQRVLYK